MNKRLIGATVMVLASGLAACTSTPKVSYVVIKSEADTSAVFDTYRLQANKITLAATPGEPGQPATAGKPAVPATKTRVTITSTPAETSEVKLGVRHRDDFWTTSKVNLTKFDNTDLLKEAGVDTTNNTVTIINEVGAFAKVAIGLAGFAAGDEVEIKDLPQELDMLALIKKTGDKTAAYEIKPSAGIILSIGPVPTDAVAFDQVKWDTPQGKLLYAACRTVDVQINIKNEATPFSKTVKIADPNYIQAAALPYKGKVTMHSECGASVQTETAGDPTTALSIATALATQAKAISDALKDDKK